MIPLSGGHNGDAAEKSVNTWQFIFEHYFQDNPKDNAIFPTGPEGFHLFGIDLTITPHIITLWGICFAMVGLFSYLGWRYKRGAAENPSRFGILIEMVVIFVRDDILKPFLGKSTVKFLPYFLTLFFFILFANLWGNIPIPYLQKVATANFAVTTTLMIFTFIMVNAWGFYRNGFIGYLKTFKPGGVHPIIAGFIWFFEFLSLFIRHIALTIRLFANMVGGHITLFAILYLIVQFQSYIVAIGALPISVAIYLLELFVALLQAYIFTLLSAVFIGLAGEAH